MSSIRRYSGLTNLLLIGWYGDGLTGGTGSAACSGLISTKAAPRPRLLHAARSARSRRSPWPQDRRDRTEYSWTVNPQPRCGGAGAVRSPDGGPRLGQGPPATAVRCPKPDRSRPNSPQTGRPQPGRPKTPKPQARPSRGPAGPGPRRARTREQ